MLRYVKNGMLLLSVAYIVIGMLLLIMPETSLLWICNIFGVVVLVTGIVCLIQYARIRGTGFTAPFMLVGGVITAGLGIFTLAKPQVVTSFLPVVFGIFIVVDGLSRIGTAIDLAKRKGQKWWVVLLLSIVSLLCGALLACSQLLNNRNVDLLLLETDFSPAAEDTKDVSARCDIAIEVRRRLPECKVYLACEDGCLEKLPALDKAVELALIGGYCVGSITPQQMRTWLNEAAEAMHRRESRRDWTCRQDVLSDE